MTNNRPACRTCGHPYHKDGDCYLPCACKEYRPCPQTGGYHKDCTDYRCQFCILDMIDNVIRANGNW